MPVLSDFTTILGDSTVEIGDGSNRNGWTANFDTGGRTGGTAFITFMMKGLTKAQGNAQVFVNDTPVGYLFHSNGGNANHWSMQTVSLKGGTLKDGGNVLRVESVQATTSGYDNYFLRDIICHFHQEA